MLIVSPSNRRLHKTQSNVLEIFKLSQEFPLNSGLRLIFCHPLSPFAFISTSPTDSHYLLYTLTVSGIAYFIKISKDLASIVSRDELIELDVRDYSNSNEPITCIAAKPGCLLLGRNDGSVTCFRLGLLHQTAPGILFFIQLFLSFCYCYFFDVKLPDSDLPYIGFVYELRDDSGISLGRLWGFMSRYLLLI